MNFYVEGSFRVLSQPPSVEACFMFFVLEVDPLSDLEMTPQFFHLLSV